jgi:hypothetical protein
MTLWLLALERGGRPVCRDAAVGWRFARWAPVFPISLALIALQVISLLWSIREV